MTTITNLQPVLSENQNKTNSKLNELITRTNGLQRSNFSFNVGTTNQALFLTSNIPGGTTITLSGKITVQVNATNYTQTAQVHIWTYDHAVHFNSDGTFYEQSATTNRTGNTNNITIQCGISGSKVFLKVNNLDGQNYTANGYVQYYFGNQYADLVVE